MRGFQHRFAHANGIRMHYVDEGSGPLVILCHGFPETWYSWRHQIRCLAEAGFRVVAPDQRGYGETEGPGRTESYDLCHLVGDIVGLLYDLNEGQAIIIGHDWGSTVASTCALVRPDLFYAAGLLSVPYLPQAFGGRRPTEAMRESTGETLDFYQLYFQRSGVPEAEMERDVVRTLQGMYFSASADAPAGRRWRTIFSYSERFIDTIPAPESMPAWIAGEDFDYCAQQFIMSGFGGPLNWYRNIDRNSELLAFLRNGRVRQPSFFVAGAQDPIADQYRHAFDALEETMPGLRFKTLIPDAGHWVQQEQPERVNELILSFCEEVRGSLTGSGEAPAVPAT